MTQSVWHVAAYLPEAVLIVDDFNCDWPTMTVTNDAQAVVHDLIFEGRLDPQVQRLLYRDTEGTWDEILFERDWPHAFLGFAPVGVKTLEEALANLRRGVTA